MGDNLLPMQERRVRSLGREDLLEGDMAAHSSILNFTDSGAWRVTVHGVKKSQTGLSN